MNHNSYLLVESHKIEVYNEGFFYLFVCFSFNFRDPLLYYRFLSFHMLDWEFRSPDFSSEFVVLPQSCVRVGESLDLSEPQKFHLANGEMEFCPSKCSGGLR